ncbi:MAG: putative purine permease YwdJ [Syntrophaceae bacterium PtaU1.Bin231]|nr:MAG: putative purine permease YwdJ [Syntrophaceae bacterium PtaU1.Bin231]
MEFRYGLDDHPPWWQRWLYGLQWFAVTVPIIVIVGRVTGGLHFTSPGDQVIYLQKLSFVMAAALLLQVLAGHRLPLITGPSTVLLIGAVASRGYAPQAIYTAILCGGLLLTLLSITGLFGHLRRLFTPRVVAVVLLLIAFTLTPTILQLMTGPPGAANLAFGLALTLAMFAMHRLLRGVWKATLIVWAMAAGALIAHLLFPAAEIPAASAALFAGFFRGLSVELVFDGGVLASFLFCYAALAVNDLGSMQSMNELLKPVGMDRRIRNGVIVTGLTNAASGLLGVIGPVNYSLSLGVIAATGCASRFTLPTTAAMLLVLSFSPALIALIGDVPSVVIGAVLLYIVCTQIAAGLVVAFEARRAIRMEDGLVIGLPILLGTIIAFLPQEVLQAFPGGLRPVLGNGFAMGVTAALLMEHLVFADKERSSS